MSGKTFLRYKSIDYTHNGGIMDKYLQAERKRLSFVKLLREAIGCPYIWGANGPHQFDCSGLIVYALREIGLLHPAEDMTTGGLAEKFRARTDPKMCRPGQLAFYGESVSRIYHVMAVLTTWGNGRVILVGARSGNSTTKTPVIAYRQKAFVTVTHGDYWKTKRVLVVDPFRV